MAYRKTEFVERKRLETRARIVEAAASLVRNEGWRGCVLKAVAEGAGVSTGSLYTHFAKITDLYTEVYSLIAEAENAALLKVAAQREARAVDRLRAAIEAFMGRALRGRVQAYAMIGEPVPPEVEELRQRVRRRFAEPFEAIIRDGVDSGEFAPQDPVVSAACILGALSESMISPLAPEAVAQSDRGEALRRHVCDFCLRAVGALESAASADHAAERANEKNIERKGGSR